MRRLYILLAAALMAATLLALAVGPAGAQSPSKKYAAIAVNEYTGKVYASYGASKSQAKGFAWNQCLNQSGTSDDHYCQGTGWVRDGYIALFYEQSFDPVYTDQHWGFGWAENGVDAQRNAEKYCEQGAKDPCEFRELVETSRWKGATTGGSW
jgi:Domain of unknown function (DUF4189)